MLTANVAEGVHRIEDVNTNWYLVEGDGGVTIVDAGVPRSWRSLHAALGALGRSASEIRALVLTHAHFDHIGFAERARRELGIPVWVHENDYPLARRPLLYGRERSPFAYMATQPKALPIVAQYVATRAFFPRRIKELRRYTDGTLDVPGSPRVVLTPGHTLGHCSLHLPDRDVLIAGDAVVMLNPYTGDRRPQIVAQCATADSQRALASLDAIADTGARTVLTGHGEPWHDGAEAIAAAARSVGVT